MGRLENIIERNERKGRPRERVVVSMVFGGIVLLIIGLMVFTDLGKPPEAAEPPTNQPVARPSHTHADGVLLGRPRKAPVSTPAPAH